MSSGGEVFSQHGNFAGLPSPLSDFETAKVSILPVPYDATTEWHSGTREGPRAIIDASFYLEMFDIELRQETCDIGIHTLPMLEPVVSGPHEMVERVHGAVKSLIEQSKFVVMLGGEHSISLGAVRAHADKFPGLTVLQLDAHSDLRDQYLGTRFGQASVMRRVAEICPIVQAGIRSMSMEEHEYVMSSKLIPHFFENEYSAAEIGQMLSSIKGDVYVTIDLDVFDPSIMSAVGTPEPGGMSWSQVTGLLKAVARQKNVVGFDVVELCPAQGPAACSFTAAKLVYRLLGYCFHKS